MNRQIREASRASYAVLATALSDVTMFCPRPELLGR